MKKSSYDLLTPIAFETHLHNIFDDAVCGVVWLGYANVLFMGLPSITAGESHAPEDPTKRRELSTHRSTWILRCRAQQICTADDTREFILASFEPLKSEPVVHWELEHTTLILHLTFKGDWSLDLMPWNDADFSAEELASDAWLLQVGNRYYAVSCAKEIHFIETGLR